MNAIHLRKQLDSETLYLPELKPLIGKTVEIIVREVLSTPFNGTSQAPGWLSPLAGSILRVDEAFFEPLLGGERSSAVLRAATASRRASNCLPAWPSK